MIFREVTYQAIVFRILASLIIGGIIGLERGMKNRAAGLRTYILVSVGACLIMLTNQYIYQSTGAGDPMRLGAQVVSGIGFLGAGTIVVTKHNQIRGLTTAAGLWASAGVGLALGIGFYEAAFAAATGIYITLTILQHWERRLRRATRLLEVYIELDYSLPLSDFVQQLRGLNLEIEDMQFENDTVFDSNIRAVVFTLKSPHKENHIILMEKIKKLSGIVHIEEL